MGLNKLTAISPIDGRYRSKSEPLEYFFSEFGLIRYRIRVEVEYLIALAEKNVDDKLPAFSDDQKEQLRELYNSLTVNDSQRVKDIEIKTNHDVKAVEYYIKDALDKLNLSSYKEYVHFGLTSQDVNNTAIPLSIKEALETTFLPTLDKLIQQLKTLGEDWKDVSMLARTHGQPASPTRLGKEIDVFTERIEKQVKLLDTIPYSAKFGGATGNFNAHLVAFPEENWKAFADHFVNEILGLDRSQTTTQIEHYDNMAALFDNLKRINTIIKDLNQDMWIYISMEYFKQEITDGEVGSSAMPHKVNPIDFENSEGNIGIANAIYDHLSSKLPVSRLQRDLTDSTVLRNVGVPFAHSLIGIQSTLKGLHKLRLNQEKINRDLEDNWAVVAEALQTILRSIGYPEPYEALKKLTRKNDHITAETISDFIESLEVDDNIKQKMKKITPSNYTGV